MKMKSLTGKWLAALLLLGGLSQIANAKEPTAFDLVKEGNRHLGEEAKGRVVQIRSEKSVGGLTPNIWFVVYYDPDATAKATEIKFAAGTKVSVKRPARILEPLNKNRPLTNTEWKLERGESDVPVLKVKVWSTKVRKPSERVNVGDLEIA